MRARGRRLQMLRSAMRTHDPLCAHCRDIDQVRKWDELDHILPLHKGGTDDLDNLQGLCTEHHAAKTRIDLGYKSTGECDLTGQPIDPKHPWNENRPHDSI